MKFIIVSMAALAAASCTHAADSTASSSKGVSDVRAALEAAVSNTPYSALVRIIKMERTTLTDDGPTDDLTEDHLTIHVQVLNTLTGPVVKHLQYTMVVEQGESVNLPKEPVIVTLCQDQEQFYWPGTGSLFLADKNLVSAAAEIAETRGAGKSNFAYCR